MSFPPPHTIDPKSLHTHTAILLHGRASDGDEFAEDLFSSHTSQNQKNLATHFPGWRWVFPTSRDRWSSVFKEDLTAWFDAYSLADPCARQDLQIEGLKESTLYVLDVLRREIDLLRGRSERVVLGGISQGMATALWALLCSPGRVGGMEGIGAFVGFCGWLPLGDRLEGVLQKKKKKQQQQQQQGGGGESGDGQEELESTMKMIQCIPSIFGLQEVRATKADIDAMLSVPMLQLHGSDDVWIDIELGRQAHRILSRLGFQVDWKEYVGAENDGHWVKEPEGFDMIVSFLRNALKIGHEEEVS